MDVVDVVDVRTSEVGVDRDAPVIPPDDVPVVSPRDVQSPPPADVQPPPPIDITVDMDLLIEVDNSASMAGNQTQLLPQIAQLVSEFTNPPDRNNDGRPDFAPFRSVHVGVISSDLGTPGATVRRCDNPDMGDDGLLNPIRFGASMARHEPWTAAPAGFRPDDCNRPDQFPSFITFTSGATDLVQFDHDVRCNAGVYTLGCGLEAQLEAVWRAIVYHRADDSPGNTDPNAGFIRENALLAIVLLTDEEDGSVRDCRFAEPGVACRDALGVYNAVDRGWSSENLNLRFYMYQPCGAADPTWPLDRYFDPSNPGRGFLSAKPGHPERVLFAAITGIPLQAPRALDGTPDWDALLGSARGGRADDFCGRDSATAINTTSPEGAVSMRQANPDPNPGCADLVVPACRREGTSPPGGACLTDLNAQYFAWPARRIVEIARRFDQSTVCGGAPCRNGFVASVCANSYQAALLPMVQRIQARR